ncbi:MAG: serine/threonine-protein kinase [Litoreibacter sp.]|nr:serine/threonine-protein kinase [Litoreibacter sp.]
MGNAQERQIDDESFVDELAPGTKLLHGQFTIEKFLNSGGFGITYLARDSLDRKVVIKECFPSSFCHRSRAIVQPRSRAHTAELKSVVDLFVQEARSLSKLEHPNIVGVHQVFEDNSTAYMVLDFVEGRDLLDTLEEGNHNLTAPQIKGILKDVLGAVGYIHSQDILHRDISPDNILIDADLRPVLIDFGAAREEATKKSRVLSALRVVKDGYSPQEFYVQGSAQTPSSDLYALGATFYHLIEGEVPPNSQARLAAIAAGEEDTYQPLVDRVKGYDKKFLSAIDKSLGILPKDRLQSAQEWLDMMEGKRRMSRVVTPVAPPPSSAVAETVAAEKRNNSKLVPLLGSTAVIAILAVGGLFGTGVLQMPGSDVSETDVAVANPASSDTGSTQEAPADAALPGPLAEAEGPSTTSSGADIVDRNPNFLEIIGNDGGSGATAPADTGGAQTAEQAKAILQAEMEAAQREAEEQRQAEIAAAEAEAQRLAEIQAAQDSARREAEAAAAKAAEEAEARRQADVAATEAEAQRLAEIIESEAEARRQAEVAAAEAEEKRLAEVAAAEEKRLADIAAAEAEAQRLAEVAAAEAEARRQAEAAVAKAEEQRLADIAAAEAEAKRLAEVAAAEAQARREAEAAAAEANEQRLAEIAAAEAEAERLAEVAAAEAEARRQAEIEVAQANEQRLADIAAAEAEAQRQAEIAEAEAEARRQAEIEVAEAKRQVEIAAVEAEARRLAQIEAAEAAAQRQAEIAEAEAEAQRLADISAAEAETKRQAEVAAAEAEAQRQAEIAAAEAEAQSQPAISFIEARPAPVQSSSVLSAWSLELPFSGEGDSNVITDVNIVAPAWATPGTKVVAVNGAPVENLADISAVLRNTTQPSEGATQRVSFMLQPEAGGTLFEQTWEFPIVQETALLNGIGFSTRFNGENWTTVVTDVPSGGSDFQVGDELIALMTTSERIEGRNSLQDIVERELENGQTEFSFAVSRDGSMWVVSMTYSGGV